MRKFLASLLLLTLPFLAAAQPIIPSTGYTIGFMTNLTAASARDYLGIGGTGISASMAAWVTKAGSDTTGQITNSARPYATVHAAVNALNATYNSGTGNTNLLVLVGPGFFDEGTNSITPTNGMAIQGAGEYATWISSQADFTTNGAIIVAWDGVSVQDLTISGTLTNGQFQGCFGVAGTGYGTNFSGTAYLNNVGMWGDSDNLIINLGGNNFTNTVIARNTHFHARWDCVANNALNSGSTNSTILLDGFSCEFIGASVAGAASSSQYRGVVAAGGTIIAKNGVLTFPASTSALFNTNGQIGFQVGGGSATANTGFASGLLINNSIGTNAVSTTNADFVLKVGTVGKKTSMIIGPNCVRFDGAQLNINTVAAGISSFGTTLATTTLSTNQFTIAATGWTNTNIFPCVAYPNAVAATITFSDGTNTVRTFTAVTQELTLDMPPGYKFTAASGLSGIAVPKKQ